MESLYRKKSIQLIVCTIILFGLVGALGLFAQSMERKKQKVIDIKERLASYEQNKKIFQQETKRLERVGERTWALEAKRITSENLPALLSSIESLAAAQGVTFAITQVETPVVDVGPQKLTIAFSAQGSFANLQALLHAMTHQVYQVTFTTFSLYSDPSAKSGAGFDMLGTIEVISF